MGRPGVLLPGTHTVLGFRTDKFGQIIGGIPPGGCPPGFTEFAKGCYETTFFNWRRAQYEQQKASGGLVGTFTELLPNILRVVFPLFSVPGIHAGLPEVAYSAGTSLVGIPAPIASAALNIGTSLVTGNLLSGGVAKMGLNIGGLLGGIGGLLGGVSAVPALSGVGQIVSAFAPAFSQPAAIGPIYQPPQPMQQPMGQPVMAAAPVIAAGAGAIARMTAPILFKIGSKLGKRVSLSHAITIIRKMGKMLMDPAAIGVALGITMSELATLITAHSSRKTRHMNAANPKALRRAARRIKSFHRMCGHIDLLKGRGRRVSAGRSIVVACPTCRKSPCRC